MFRTRLPMSFSSGATRKTRGRAAGKNVVEDVDLHGDPSYTLPVLDIR